MAERFNCSRCDRYNHRPDFELHPDDTHDFPCLSPWSIQREYYQHYIGQIMDEFKLSDVVDEVVSFLDFTQCYVDQRLSIMDKTGKWYMSTVLKVDTVEERAYVHYIGWNPKWDEWIDANSDRIAEVQRTSRFLNYAIAASMIHRVEKTHNMTLLELYDSYGACSRDENAALERVLQRRKYHLF